MKVKIVANELLDSSIEFVSLVKNGAIRSPFKILKEEKEMTQKRNERREQMLAARQNPVRRNTLAAIQKSAQRAADIGCAAIFKDEFEPDVNADRHGRDNLQANTDESRTAGENDSIYRRLAEIRRLLEEIGMALTSERLASEVEKLEAAQARLRKAERGLQLHFSSAFKGGDLTWLEDQGRRMVEMNEALMADVRLNRLDESLAPSRNAGGIEKADGADRVMEDALSSGMGVTGKYK